MTRAPLLYAFVAAIAVAGTGADARVLRVCADPNNLPFSNARGEGFENRIAEIVARDLGAHVVYTWQPRRRGFLRNTLNRRACDVVMGEPAGADQVLTTRPYYRSTYVSVSRPGARRIVSLDDPSLPSLRVGVQMIGDDFANTPPAHALSRRGITAHVVGFPVYGNYAQPNPAAAIVDAVARGDVDTAFVWGPIAGYFAAREPSPLAIAPLRPEDDGPARPFTFAIAAAVRRDDGPLRDALDRVLARRRAEIASVLAAFDVPALPLGKVEEAAR